MSKQYDEYLTDHLDGVRQAYLWLEKNIPDIFVGHEEEQTLARRHCLFAHDASKKTAAEYPAYDDYFYGEKTDDVIDAFNYAWLHHIHKNPHHWQHWVLIHDDEPMEALEMPFEYVIEMICDWWSFSWKKGDLNEIFQWYEDHKGMLLHPETRKLVESILARIKEKLKEERW